MPNRTTMSIAMTICCIVSPLTTGAQNAESPSIYQGLGEEFRRADAVFRARVEDTEMTGHRDPTTPRRLECTLLVKHNYKGHIGEPSERITLYRDMDRANEYSRRLFQTVGHYFFCSLHEGRDRIFLAYERDDGEWELFNDIPVLIVWGMDCDTAVGAYLAISEQEPPDAARSLTTLVVKAFMNPDGPTYATGVLVDDWRRFRHHLSSDSSDLRGILSVAVPDILSSARYAGPDFDLALELAPLLGIPDRRQVAKALLELNADLEVHLAALEKDPPRDPGCISVGIWRAQEIMRLHGLLPEWIGSVIEPGARPQPRNRDEALEVALRFVGEDLPAVEYRTPEQRHRDSEERARQASLARARGADVPALCAAATDVYLTEGEGFGGSMENWIQFKVLRRLQDSREPEDEEARDVWVRNPPEEAWRMLKGQARHREVYFIFLREVPDEEWRTPHSPPDERRFEFVDLVNGLLAANTERLRLVEKVVGNGR